MNGTSEAFLHVVATENQLKCSNDSLLVFSLIYVVLNVLLIRSVGAIGLIMANSLNMILRIIYSAVFIKHYFHTIFCYWITSNIVSIAYGTVIKSPGVKKFLGILEIPVTRANTALHAPLFNLSSAVKQIMAAKQKMPNHHLLNQHPRVQIKEYHQIQFLVRGLEVWRNK